MSLDGVMTGDEQRLMDATLFSRGISFSIEGVGLYKALLLVWLRFVFSFSRRSHRFAGFHSRGHFLPIRPGGFEA